MILSNKTKEKIINIRDFYEKREQDVDIKFIKEILSFIQKEETFKDVYKYKFIKSEVYGFAYTESGVININANYLINFSKNKPKDYFSNYSSKDSVKYQILVILITILHESFHVFQQKGLENYSEINRLNNDVMNKKFLLKDFYKMIKWYINYNKLGERAYFERQANINTLKELISIYQGYNFIEWLELQHIYNLSFKPTNESIVHDTLKGLSLKYNYNCENIPSDLLFEVGLPTKIEYSNSIYDAINKYYKKELSYNNVIEKIKKV